MPDEENPQSHTDVTTWQCTNSHQAGVPHLSITYPKFHEYRPTIMQIRIILKICLYGLLNVVRVCKIIKTRTTTHYADFNLRWLFLFELQLQGGRSLMRACMRASFNMVVLCLLSIFDTSLQCLVHFCFKYHAIYFAFGWAFP